MRGKLSIISGRSHHTLAANIAAKCGIKLTECEFKTFSDGEIFVEIQENVRGGDIFVVQSTSHPGNDNLMELLIIMDALRRASSERITAVIPYFGYARQDRKTQPRVPITAKLVADLIVAAGADRVLTMDLHAGQLMGFFNIPVDNLYARPVMLEHIKQCGGNSNKLTIVSPDAGGVPRARAYAKRLDANLAIIDKRRATTNEIAEMNVIGDVKGSHCVIIDDIVDTGGTLIKAANALLESGAVNVAACCTHAVLSGSAKAQLPKSSISQLVVSDSIDHTDLDQYGDFFRVVSVASLFGESVMRIHNDDSVSSLFDQEFIK